MDTLNTALQRLETLLLDVFCEKYHKILCWAWNFLPVVTKQIQSKWIKHMSEINVFPVLPVIVVPRGKTDIWSSHQYMEFLLRLYPRPGMGGHMLQPLSASSPHWSNSIVERTIFWSSEPKILLSDQCYGMVLRTIRI